MAKQISEFKQIINRWTGKVMCNGLSLEVVLEQHKKWRNLDGGERADLSDAVLSGAVLSGAVLRGADLRGADLSGAVLSGADLSGAVLSGAVLRGAVLSGAVLSDAVLSDAVLSGADLSGVPKIEKIHQRIYEAVTASPDKFDMSSWHSSCGTTHCRAGWVVTLAGDAGKAMEFCMGTGGAAALIYMASDPKLEKIPNWTASNEAALEDMKRLAEQEKAA